MPSTKSTRRSATVSTEEAFWTRVEKRGPDGCWIWRGSSTYRGHLFHVGGGKRVSAARFSWEMVHGTIQGQQHVRAACGASSCVNPDHLRLGGTNRRSRLDIVVEDDRNDEGDGATPPVPASHQGRAWRYDETQWRWEAAEDVPYDPPDESTVERFWRKVRRCGPRDCWPWRGSVDGEGYGIFCTDGKVVAPRRFAWTLKHGPIEVRREEPPGEHELPRVYRTCDTENCVNPAHALAALTTDPRKGILPVRKPRNRRPLHETLDEAEPAPGPYCNPFRKSVPMLAPRPAPEPPDPRRFPILYLEDVLGAWREALGLYYVASTVAQYHARLKTMLAPLDDPLTGRLALVQWRNVDLVAAWLAYRGSHLDTTLLPPAWAHFHTWVKRVYQIDLPTIDFDAVPAEVGIRLTTQDIQEIRRFRAAGVSAHTLIKLRWDDNLVEFPPTSSVQPLLLKRWNRLGQPRSGWVFPREPGSDLPIPIGVLHKLVAPGP